MKMLLGDEIFADMPPNPNARTTELMPSACLPSVLT